MIRQLIREERDKMIRSLIREILLEDLTGFQQRTKGIDYMSNFDDPTFDLPAQKDLPHKGMAKDIKRAWAAEADHEFMKSLIKVHWVGGLDWEKKLDSFLSLGGNNEISTMGYLPNSLDVRSSWGAIGVIVQGRVTLAANSMNAITSGYFKDVPEEFKSKYKSSGVPRRATTFASIENRYGYNPGGGSDAYILDRSSFNPQSSRNNELIVDNWRPVGIVIGILRVLFLKAVRDAVKKDMQDSNINYAKVMLGLGLPIYDVNMKTIDREEIEKAIRGEG